MLQDESNYDQINVLCSWLVSCSRIGSQEKALGPSLGTVPPKIGVQANLVILKRYYQLPKK